MIRCSSFVFQLKFEGTSSVLSSRRPTTTEKERERETERREKREERREKREERESEKEKEKVKEKERKIFFKKKNHVIGNSITISIKIEIAYFKYKVIIGMNFDPWKPGQRSLMQHYRLVVFAGGISAVLGVYGAISAWNAVSGHFKPDEKKQQ